jgi:hypothetical protein
VSAEPVSGPGEDGKQDSLPHGAGPSRAPGQGSGPAGNTNFAKDRARDPSAADDVIADDGDAAWLPDGGDLWLDDEDDWQDPDSSPPPEFAGTPIREPLPPPSPRQASHRLAADPGPARLSHVDHPAGRHYTTGPAQYPI